VSTADRQQTIACWRTIGVWGNQKPRCEKLNELIHCRNCETFYAAAEASFQNRSSGTAALEKSRELLERLHQQVQQGDLSIVPFRLGRFWFGIETAAVKMVAAECRIHTVPFRARPALLGLIPVNGEAVTCVCLSEIIGVRVNESPSTVVCGSVFHRFLVLKMGDSRVAFKVDEVLDVARHFFDELIETKPEDKQLQGYSQYQLLIKDKNISVCILEEKVLLAAIARALE
jgi:chemotaxis-related protein WspD